MTINNISSHYFQRKCKKPLQQLRFPEILARSTQKGRAAVNLEKLKGIAFYSSSKYPLFSYMYLS